jgi:acyl carrier protein
MESLATITVEYIRDVLITAICAELEISPKDLRTDRQFEDYGVASLSALSISTDLEHALGLFELPATLLWDYPTVDALVPALWRILHDQDDSTAAGSAR